MPSARHVCGSEVKEKQKTGSDPTLVTLSAIATVVVLRATWKSKAEWADRDFRLVLRRKNCENPVAAALLVVV